MVRALDRAVLEVARRLDLRPMELYALLLLRAGGRLTTAALADQLAASPSQAKQLALRLCVRGMAERRVSAAEAANLYEETEQSTAERERQMELRRLGGPVDLGGRPTKRDRRRYDAGRRSKHS